MIEYRGKEYYNTMKMSSSTLTLFLEKSPRKVAAGLLFKFLFYYRTYITQSAHLTVPRNGRCTDSSHDTVRIFLFFKVYIHVFIYIKHR